MERPSGILKIQTLRKLPTMAPKIKAETRKKVTGMSFKGVKKSGVLKGVASFFMGIMEK